MVELVRSENQFISIPKNMIRPKLSIKLFKLFLSVNGSYRYYKLIVIISKISLTLILTKNFRFFRFIHYLFFFFSFIKGLM